MELRGIGTTRRRHPVGAITSTTLENRVKWSITINPVVGWRSNFFHEFSEAVFDGVIWNGYDMATTSGRGNSTDSAREPGQKVHNYRSDRWIPLKICHEFLKAVLYGVAWNRYDTLTTSGRGHSTDNTIEPGQRYITIDPTVGSRSNVFHEFPEAVFDGVAWNRYDTPTASGRGYSTDNAREPG